MGGKFLKVKLIQKKGLVVKPAYFFDEGSKVEWTPNPEKLTTTAPGVKIASYDDEWYGTPVTVVEMDGKIDNIEEFVYIESQLCNAGTKYYGELSEQMVANKEAPGCSRRCARSRSARRTRPSPPSKLWILRASELHARTSRCVVVVWRR